MGYSEYFEMEQNGERIGLEIHTQNPAHEARIRWTAINQGISGEWGRLYLPEAMSGGTDQIIQEPILAFGVSEPITVGGKERLSIGIPRPLASQLQEQIDELGTVTIDDASVSTDPARFPSTIEYRTRISTEHLDKAWWDPNRYIMWYSPDKPEAQNISVRLADLVSQLDVYGYQIENGDLVHRTNEIPSSEAVDDLKQLLARAGPEANTRGSSGPYRVEHRLD